MNRRQAKILIGAIKDGKEIVLPRTHTIVKQLSKEGYLEEVVYEIPKADGENHDRIGQLMKWIMSGAVSTTVNGDKKACVILHKPTKKAQEWLDALLRSRRNKDAKLLIEAGYYAK